MFPKNKLNIYEKSSETIEFWITESNSHKRFAVLVDNNFHGLLKGGKLATFIHKHNQIPPEDDDGRWILESKSLIIISEFNDLIASDKTCLENNEKVFKFVQGVSLYQIPFSNLEDDLKKIFNKPS